MASAPPIVEGMPPRHSIPAKPASSDARTTRASWAPPPARIRVPSSEMAASSSDQRQHDRVETLVRHQHVGAEPQDQPGDAGLARGPHRGGHTIRAGTAQQHAARAADPQGGVGGERLVARLT